MSEVFWLEQNTGDLPEKDDWLSASELEILHRMRFAKRRADWLLGRWTAKQALTAYLAAYRGEAASLAQIEIRPAPSGAPEVFLKGSPAAIAISLSHSDGVALCAIAASGTALGCDLELIEPRSDSFIADYLTPEEHALLSPVRDARRDLFVTLLWSAKESALKAMRLGLRADTRTLIVSPEGLHSTTANMSWSPLSVQCTSGPTFHGWWRQSGHHIQTLVAFPRPVPPTPIRRAPDLQYVSP